MQKNNKVKMEIKDNRDFKGVFIPKKVWLDENLNWTEKLLLVEINSLDNEDGCYAGNEHFSKFFGLSKDRVSRMISSLKEKDYINSEIFYKQGTKEVDKRVILVNRNKFYDTNEDRTHSYKNLGGIVEKTDTPIGENAKDINTLNTINTINNKDINICPISSDDIEMDKSKSDKLANKKAKQQDLERKFDQWYNLYANKHGRQKAFTAFQKVLDKFDYDKLMYNTGLYIEPYVKGLEDKNWQKHPTTFLNSYHPDDDFAYKPKQQFNRGGYQQNEGFKRADDFDSFKARTGVDAPF